jgi:uncharacterized FAD-dependent dehydrogenase
MQTKQYIIDDVCLSPRDAAGKGEEASLRAFLESSLRLTPVSFSILRRSIDARKKNQVVWRYRLAGTFDAGNPAPADMNLEEYFPSAANPVQKVKRNKHILVIGSGPAGLFCSLRLLDLGFEVTMIERGRPVDERETDVDLLKTKGILNAESNVLFGEGGAGTYSDGKLTTRTNRPEAEWFFETMVRYGAKSDILYDAKPHVGTDLLSNVVGSIRRDISTRGANVLFGEKVCSLIIENNQVLGAVCASGKEFRADSVVLACGHSARDTYEMIFNNGVALEKKGYAVGMRVEHPAEFINKAQYGDSSAFLPAADYRLVYNDRETGRGVYSFCMCPGGEVVNSSSEQDALCVNGMSYSDRGLQWSNAAIVVSVSADDIPGDALAGIGFQRDIERRCFSLGGGGFTAPSQPIASFLNAKGSARRNYPMSYRPGTAAADLSSLYPSWITDPLRRGFRKFDSLIRGFSSEGVLIGAETRTSSPIRITRNEIMQSVSHRALYPVGEGAGYAGGIVSSAVDGIRCADCISKFFEG